MPDQGATREDIERRLNELQDRGIVDLDAPLREAIPAIAKNIVQYRSAERWWILAVGGGHAVCECG